MGNNKPHVVLPSASTPKLLADGWESVSNEASSGTRRVTVLATTPPIMMEINGDISPITFQRENEINTNNKLLGINDIQDLKIEQDPEVKVECLRACSEGKDKFREIRYKESKGYKKSFNKIGFYFILLYK